MCVHLCEKTKGGDWEVQIGRGIWKDYSPSSVFFFLPFLVLSFFGVGRWGFRSLLTPERLITIHMSHTPHIIRVRKQN